jgi:phosphocarrier protein
MTINIILLKFLNLKYKLFGGIEMVEKKVVIKNETGIHARPASMIVQLANKYGAEVTLGKDGNEVNAKSIMGIMSLGVSKSTEVTVKAEGEDAQDAVNALVELLESGFGE